MIPTPIFFLADDFQRFQFQEKTPTISKWWVSLKRYHVRASRMLMNAFLRRIRQLLTLLIETNDIIRYLYSKISLWTLNNHSRDKNFART